MQVDRAVCLLLDKRWENREGLAASFERVGIPLLFFLVGDGQTLPGYLYQYIDREPPPRTGYPAWVKRPNSWNAFQSYRRIIREAKEVGAKNLLLVEDDCLLADNFREVAGAAYSQMVFRDPGWKMLYLGGNHSFRKPTVVAPNLLRVNGSGGFHCVLLSDRAFDDVLSLPMDGPIDGMAGEHIHPGGHCWAAWPNLATTSPGYSFCEGREVDYSHMWGRR